MSRKKRDTSSGLRPPSPQGEGEAARYQHWYCESCRKKLGGLGYILTETGRASAWHICGLCGRTALITPTEIYKPPKRYRKRTGAGERGRAGRR